MKRVIRRPSPAMIVAIVALIAALGGTAVAGGFITKKKAKNIANNQITQRAPGLSVASAKSADSAKNSDALQGLPLRGVSQWVVSSSGGTVVSSSGGVTITKLAGAGRYRVSFPSSLANCGFNANGGIQPTASDASNFADAMALVARSSTGPNDVQVEMDNAAGTEIDEPFYLTVQC
jgi:hypothetical protein